MNRNALFVFAILSLLLVSCGGLQNASFYRSPVFNPNSTFKVITLNTNDIIAGRLEHYLLTNDFRVISDNSFRLPGNNIFPNPTFPFDSTSAMVVNIPYMDNKPSDYIIRYQLDNPRDIEGRKVQSSLNIAVVNTVTGETEISFLSQGNSRLEQPQLDRVIRDFIGRLKRR